MTLTPKSPLKVSAGNIGTLIAGKVLSKSNQGCFRRIVLRNYGIQEAIDSRARVTFSIGKALESVFEEENPSFYMNVRMSEMPHISEQVVLGLECDSYNSKDQVVYELKSVSSTKALKDIFVLGNPKRDNLVQLATYLLVMDCEATPMRFGYLRYTNTIYDHFTVAKKEHKFAAGDVKEFRVEWEGNNLLVDGNKCGITAEGISRFLEYAAWVLEEMPPPHTILPPLDEEDKPIACMYCHWREECKFSDQRELSMLEFVELCSQK